MADRHSSSNTLLAAAALCTLACGACTLPDVNVAPGTHKSSDGVSRERDAGSGNVAPASGGSAAVSGARAGSGGRAEPVAGRDSQAGTTAKGGSGGAAGGKQEVSTPTDMDSGVDDERSWSEPETLNLGPDAGFVQLSADSDGATLSWAETGASAMKPSVAARSFTRSQGWSSSSPIFQGTLSDTRPFAMATAGPQRRFVLIWSNELMFAGSTPLEWAESSSGMVLESHSADAGRTWSAPVSMGISTLNDQGPTCLSVAEDGSALVGTARIVREAQRIGWVVEARQYAPNTNSWSDAKEIARATTAMGDTAEQQAAAEQYPIGLGVALSNTGQRAYIWRGFQGGVQAAVATDSAAAALTHLSAKPGTTASSDSSVADPRIAWDGHGGAVAVWLDYNGTYWIVRTSRYNAAANSFMPALTLQTNVNGDAMQPELAIDAEGNALIAWTQSGGSSIAVWSARCPTVGECSKPARIDPVGGTSNASSLSLAADAMGNAWAVWEDVGMVRASRYKVGQGWGLSTQLSPGTQVSQVPKVVVNSQGDAYVLWFEKTATQPILHFRRFE